MKEQISGESCSCGIILEKNQKMREIPTTLPSLFLKGGIVTEKRQGADSGHTAANILCSALNAVRLCFNGLMVWLLLVVFFVTEVLVVVVLNPLCWMLIHFLAAPFRLWNLNRWLALLVIALVSLGIVWLISIYW